MFNFFTDNNNFPTKLFVGTSLLSFLLLGVILTVLMSKFASDGVSRNNFVKEGRNDKKNVSEQNRNANYPVSPLITKSPNLGDMLEGPITDKKDPVLGPVDAPITIVEFADYKCGVCQEQQKILKKIRSAYKDKVRIIWKDYPVVDQNSLSFRAARAARCAGEQNSFWEYNEKLYKEELLEREDQKEREFFVRVSKDIGLDSSTFRRCLKEKQVDDMIINNIKEADALGISGIPFIYVNDQEIMGEISYDELKRMIEIELNDARD